MDVIVMPHAVERFVQRWFPGTGDQEAESRIKEMLARASHVKERTAAGDVLWECDGIRFVMKYDKGHGNQTRRKSNKIFCVTVLPKDDYDPVGEAEEPWQMGVKVEPTPDPAPMSAILDLSKELETERHESQLRKVLNGKEPLSPELSRSQLEWMALTLRKEVKAIKPAIRELEREQLVASKAGRQMEWKGLCDRNGALREERGRKMDLINKVQVLLQKTPKKRR